MVNFIIDKARYLYIKIVRDETHHIWQNLQCRLDTTRRARCRILLKLSVISSLYALRYSFFHVCHIRRLHDISFFYRLFLCCIQQLGQTSRWHFYISWFSQTISTEYRLPSVHIHWSCRWNCCPNVSSIQHSSHLARVSDLYISEE